jgi:N utilization substance protein B
MTTINRKEQHALGKRYARLAAVQYIYARELDPANKDSAATLLELYETGELQQQEYEADKDLPKIRPAKQLYEFLTDAYHASPEAYQARMALMSEYLTRSKEVESLGPLMRAIFHAALIELMQNEDVPTDVILHEYVSITRQFFDAPELVGFVNANLEPLAKHIRPNSTT